jgi:RNA polymerase sigma factor (sigma-70 family)
MRDQFFQTALPVALRAAKIWAAKNKWLLSDPGWDTEDLAQDVLCRLYIAVASFDATRASLFTYTERVVTNHIFSLQRKRLGCKGTRIEQGLLDIPTADVISRIELRVDVRRLVQALSHKDRIVAQLLMADSRPAEIAQRLGTSRGSVYRSIHRIRSVFRASGFSHHSRPPFRPRTPLEAKHGRS